MAWFFRPRGERGAGSLPPPDSRYQQLTSEEVVRDQEALEEGRLPERVVARISRTGRGELPWVQGATVTGFGVLEGLGFEQVAQVAAVIGREFSYELLQAVLPMPEDELQSALEKLADAELVYTRGIAPEAVYQFKHALIQDAAYEALLKSRRRELHGRVARTLAEKFPALAQAQPEVLARHWTQAGEAERAVEAWKNAAIKAYSRGAYKEALEDYRQGLAMLQTLPESAERDIRELKLRNWQIATLVVTKGLTAPEAVETSVRARALAEKSGNLAQLVAHGAALCGSVLATGDNSSAAALADQLLDLAQREGSPASLATAYLHKLVACFYRGELRESEERFTRWIGVLKASGFRPLYPGTFTIPMGHGALNAWVLGYAEKARERSAQVTAFACEGKSPYDVAYAYFSEGFIYRLLREPREAEAAARKAITISDKYTVSSPGQWACVVMGWAQAQLGNAEEGILRIREATDALLKAGTRIAITDFLTALAEALALNGMVEDALGTLEDAFQANPQELVFRPHILQVRGELRLKLGQSELAEADFREAISLAQKMSAKAFELRAAMGLARMLEARGDRPAARDLLAPLYTSFTEGFDTPDLKEAKALLDELAE